MTVWLVSTNPEEHNMSETTSAMNLECEAVAKLLGTWAILEPERAARDIIRVMAKARVEAIANRATPQHIAAAMEALKEKLAFSDPRVQRRIVDVVLAAVEASRETS